VCVCVCVCPHGTTQLPLDGIFMKLDILRNSGESAEKIRVSLISNTNNRNVT